MFFAYVATFDDMTMIKVTDVDLFVDSLPYLKRRRLQERGLKLGNGFAIAEPAYLPSRQSEGVESETLSLRMRLFDSTHERLHIPTPHSIMKSPTRPRV